MDGLAKTKVNGSHTTNPDTDISDKSVTIRVFDDSSTFLVLTIQT